MVHVGFLNPQYSSTFHNIGYTDNICDNLSLYFYRAVMPQCPPVYPFVTFRSLLGAVITLVGILRK